MLSQISLCSSRKPVGLCRIIRVRPRNMKSLENSTNGVILWPKYFTLSFPASIPNFHVFNFYFFFVSELVVLWLLRIFVLSGWILRPTFSVTFLNSTQHFPYLFFGCCEQHHVVGKSQVREAGRWSWSLRYIPILFFFCHRWISSFSEYWRTVLNPSPAQPSPAQSSPVQSSPVQSSPAHSPLVTFLLNQSVRRKVVCWSGRIF